jgi:hypothetical protein
MVRFTTFLTRYRVPARCIPAAATNHLGIGEVVICRWWQVVPTEQNEARLALRLSCPLDHACALTIHRQVIVVLTIALEVTRLCAEAAALRCWPPVSASPHSPYTRPAAYRVAPQTVRH